MVGGRPPPCAAEERSQVIELDDSDSSAGASKASTKTRRSFGGGAASSAEDEGGASSAKATVPDSRARPAAAGIAAVRPQRQKVEPNRHTLHPPHPFIAKCQVRWMEFGEFVY